MCGIGDYVARLSEALVRQGVNVAVLTRENCHPPVPGGPEVIALAREWRLGETGRLLSRIREYGPDAVHFQYPGLGYGFSLGPHLLALMLSYEPFPLFLTLHEFAIAHVLRRASVLPMLLRADQVVFTTVTEKASVVRHLSWLRPEVRRAAVIPIGSSLPEFVLVDSHDPKLFSFWGMFHLGKGLELLLEGFRQALERDGKLKLQLVGGVRDRDLGYIEELKALAVRLGLTAAIAMHFDRPGEEVVRLLQRSCAVVLPFADGATFRRSTLVAALRLGIPVISTRGAATPAELVHLKNVLFASSAAEFAEQIVRLSGDCELRATLSRGSTELAPLFGWDEIARAHINAYKRVINP
jgi:glycosyltransferase involved in cell wall biosynthesis